MNARQFLLKAENKLLHTNDRRYHAWFEKNRVTEAELLRQREEHFPNEPLISILVPVYKTPIPFLRAMIDSVLRQSYGRFQLILANASPEDPELFRPIYDSLLTDRVNGRADTYFTLKDFASYAQAQERVEETYRDRDRWAAMALMNTACSGKFSSDRTIEEYVRDIWHLEKMV